MAIPHGLLVRVLMGTWLFVLQLVQMVLAWALGLCGLLLWVLIGNSEGTSSCGGMNFSSVSWCSLVDTKWGLETSSKKTIEADA